MGEIKVNKTSIHFQRNESNEPSSRIGPAMPSFLAQHFQRNDSNEPAGRIGPTMPSFLTQLHEKLQKTLKSRFKRSENNDGGKSATSLLGKDKGSSTALEVNLEKQLQVWKENPIWADQPPEIKVTVPKGSLCNLNVEVNVGLPPDAVYNIVTDPDNKRVFKNIKEVLSRRVLVDEGSRQVVELEQAALWRFLWWSGTIAVHVLVDQNREDHTMKFKQVKTGFMKRFEGCWKVEPLLVDEKSCRPFIPETLEDYVTCTGGKGRVGSKVSLEQIIQPAIIPPPPISWYLRGITSKTTEMLINDLLAEAARIRGDSDAKNSTVDIGVPDECESSQILDIKQRWAMHKKNAKRMHRRLPLLLKSPTCD